MTSAVQAYYITIEEYLDRERSAAFKSEYLNGRITAMAGASMEHNRIVRNTLGELHQLLKGKPCEPLGSDMRVHVLATGLNTYPDVLVVCGEMLFQDDKRDTLINPTVLIEVLSASTEAYDRGKKFARYQSIASLCDYILISQREVRVEQFTRRPDNRWLLTTLSSLQETLFLASLDLHLSVSDLYDRVVFPQREEPLHE